MSHLSFRAFLASTCLALSLAATHAAAEPVTEADFLPFDPKQAELGQLLFYDPILSGNRNISCGTCHHHDHHGGDGLSLGIGEGGTGVGKERLPGAGETKVRKRVPRNAPSLFNLGAREVRVLFHDGRLSVSDLYENGFNSPAEEFLPDGLDSILAAQALFPMVSETEMAGNPGENEIAGATKDRIDKPWPIVAERVRAIPGYPPLFIDGFEDIEAPIDIEIQHIVNALAAFINSEWRSFDSRFDRSLIGEITLTEAESRGR
ncbi:MAG: cytochrome-c peroxidase, partial [Pseudomonadota bacterium]